MHQSQFHACLRTISRSEGRSAADISAYIAAAATTDVFTGRCYDFRKKRGVVRHGFVGFDGTVGQFALKLDSKERRRNSTTARELNLALPYSFSDDESWSVLTKISTQLRDRYNVAVLQALHRPSKRGSKKNNHGHIVFSTRRWDGIEFGKKTRELDVLKTGRSEILWIRQVISIEIRSALKRIGRECECSLWDHRSYSDRGLSFKPGRHRGYTPKANRKRSDITESKIGPCASGQKTSSGDRPETANSDQRKLVPSAMPKSPSQEQEAWHPFALTPTESRNLDRTIELLETQYSEPGTPMAKKLDALLAQKSRPPVASEPPELPS